MSRYIGSSRGDSISNNRNTLQHQQATTTATGDPDKGSLIVSVEWSQREDEWLFPANHLTAEEARAQYAMAAEALPPGADPMVISEQEFNPLQGYTRMLMGMENVQYLRKFVPCH